ncbi:MAG TPA: Fe-S cluster assembly protein HesB [Nocardioides sp.]|uniref:Fe-S cluster assembly protein HesB n=1 Tax=uncultured Nocardioides sp. TaxID=198441 RepID=UPI000EEEE21A|nr:Fe-S cluster assembly protein HesB [uncultured Nocardioides sp.]HCB04102.1 Fe-S cluster assembly protein HesB [Nocardioides sp.]HRD59418.1 Fe-S cluster assembly protein HesB [Nocardioides sp.]HRI97682.1 Fe-S cluster assembly protein HesB [Nocardioides sp.]
MLTITPRALTVIQRVSDHPSLDDTSGVRIARRRDRSRPMEVHTVQGPHPGDRLIERDGGRLYLGPEAARRVADRELDAVTDADGRVQFVLRTAA